MLLSRICVLPALGSATHGCQGFLGAKGWRGYVVMPWPGAAAATADKQCRCSPSETYAELHCHSKAFMHAVGERVLRGGGNAWAAWGRCSPVSKHIKT